MTERLFAGRYELGERLGSGGMSTVVVAMDRRLERHVAIKLLADHLAGDREFVARFRREALAAGRLVHPNIVQVFDFGVDEATGTSYIVMEQVEGQSCAEILRDRGLLPVHEALGIVAQACRGLDYAHRHGVVHRDVKPGNLLRSDDGVVKLADFGIAKALTDESSITQIGSVLGTAAYLAPEQASGQEATARSDIYSLGVVTYQLLSGHLPYDAQSLTELALKQQREAPPLLDQLNPEITPELAAAVDRALALEPEERYDTAEELRIALQDGAQGIAGVPGAEAATRIIPAASAATRIEHPTASQAVRPREPLQPAQPRHQAALRGPEDVAAPAKRRGRAGRRIAVLLLFVALGAAAVAAVTIANSSNDTVRLREVAFPKSDRTIAELQRMIRENTR